MTHLIDINPILSSRKPRSGYPGPNFTLETLGPGSAAHRFTLRCARDDKSD
jgi:hypothetical protein